MLDLRFQTQKTHHSHHQVDYGNTKNQQLGSIMQSVPIWSTVQSTLPPKPNLANIADKYIAAHTARSKYSSAVDQVAVWLPVLEMQLVSKHFQVWYQPLHP